MKVIFMIDGINYLASTKKAANDFIDYWWKETITFQEPRPFKTKWKLEHIERAPSYGQFERVNFDNVEYGKT